MFFICKEVFSLDIEKRNCPYCGEEIEANLTRCPYCGSLLGITSSSTGTPSAFDTPSATVNLSAADASASNGTSSVYGTQSSADTTSVSGTSSAIFYSPTLGNGVKVFLTVISSVIPGLGQLIGIITAMIFMSYENDPDRRSFGISLLIASIVLFVLFFMFCFFIAVIIYQINQIS